MRNDDKNGKNKLGMKQKVPLKPTKEKIYSPNDEDVDPEEQKKKARYNAEIKMSLEYINFFRRMCQYSEYSLTHKTNYSLKKGEVYEIDFGIGVNCEIRERHYGVVLVDSYENNQMAFICPLKSKHHEPNPTSDVLIGRIPEIATDRDTIAVFNQMRGIDKLRIYRYGIINGKRTVNNGPIAILNNIQMGKIHDAIIQTIINGNSFVQWCIKIISIYLVYI